MPMDKVKVPEVVLTPHFKLSEFEKPYEVAGALLPDPVPDELIPLFREMCKQLLEPIRACFDCPIRITSGYRSPEHNDRVGGAATSQHIATENYCACDFTAPVDLQGIFDWIRLVSDLPFDQVILEREKDGVEPACIHISYAKEFRRMALAGLTHGRGGYIHQDVGMMAATSLTPDLWGEA